MKKRKVAVVTGSRAEYGLLKPIIKAIKNHPKLELALIVCGMHLSPEFGSTFREIENDGYKIDVKVDMLLDSNSRASMAKSLGIGIYGIVQAIETISPDELLIYGDRMEALATAIAGSYCAIPVFHVHGGDMVKGAHIDDSNRNAITRFAHIHLPIIEKHAQRLRKSGEEGWRIHVVGLPTIETIKNEFIDTKQVVREIGLDSTKPYLLVVIHPTTSDFQVSSNQILSILNAIKIMDMQAVVIYPNADSGGRIMAEEIRKNMIKGRIEGLKNLPHNKYLSLLAGAQVMIGNSSSGIFEAPIFKVPFVNVGWRQKNRYTLKHVIEVQDFDKEEIVKAIKLAMSKRFSKKIQNLKNPFGDGKTGARVAKILSETKIDDRLLRKELTF
ncbi:MAG: UDP-N-acetylglucosamine 2-epimerase (hydrolyzing) [Nitrosopumilaceae archaeon]|nr:MAG: UDP-N-acetylglucosamine 2-epimerase (hydrolyzing) [Nitrosopumilaceae archaeon]